MIELQGIDHATGKKYGGTLVANEHEPPEEPKPKEGPRYPSNFNVADTFPEDKKEGLALGKIDASPYIQEAIDTSWEWVLAQYKYWQPEEGVNYPEFQGDKRAWGASSAAVGIPVVLPPCTLRVAQDIELPQCVPLIGAGGGLIHGGSKLVLTDMAQLQVIGNIKTDEGPFQMISGGIAGVKFACSMLSPLQLHGNCSNFKISNCHFSGVGSRGKPMIWHVNSSGAPKRFGEIVSRSGGGHTLKEVSIENCQFEGGSTAMDLTGGLNINIHNNTILYTHAGITLRNCRKVRITCNNVLGTKEGEPIQVDGQAGLIAGGSDVMAVGNQFLDLDIGCVIRGSEPNLYLNDWSRVKDNHNGATAQVNGSWRFPLDIGNFKKGDKPPFGM